MNEHKTKKEILVEELNQFRSTAFHIMDLINEIERTEDEQITERIAADFPFEKSFDEIYDDIDKWVKTQRTVIPGINMNL